MRGNLLQHSCGRAYTKGFMKGYGDVMNPTLFRGKALVAACGSCNTVAEDYKPFGKILPGNITRQSQTAITSS